jgi:polysaccharide biosynthesis protein PslG
MSLQNRLMKWWLPIGWVVTLALITFAWTPTAAPAPVPTQTPPPRLYPLPRLPSPDYGIQAFLWWHIETDDFIGTRDADLVRDMGFRWLKQQVGWRDISPLQRGQYDWTRPDNIVKITRDRGLKLLVRLDHQPNWAQADPSLSIANGPPGDPALFGEFCGAMAERYRGRIGAYEVWNEPNLAREWGNQAPDPAAYVALLKACYLAIKQADPDAIVMSAGLAPTDRDDDVSMPDIKFYQAFYQAGGAAYCDLLGVHAPGYMNPPERSSDDTEADTFLQSRVWTFRHVEDVRAVMAANHDADKQIAITEMGWTSDEVHQADYAWYAVTEEQKADYLVRAYQYAKAHWQPWIGLMSAIYISNPEWGPADEQYWWAITRPGIPQAQLLPAYFALQKMPK